MASRTSAGASPVTSLLPLTNATAGGAPVSGARWTLHLQVGGITSDFELPVTTAQTWVQITEAFAGSINAAAALPGAPLAGLVARSTSDGHLLLVDIAGRVLSASASLVPVAVTRIDAGGATTTLVNLIGTPAAGEVWRLRINDVHNGLARELSYAVQRGAVVHGVTLNSAADFAAALAYLVGNDAAAERYTALVDGSRIILIDRLGQVFSTRLQAGAITRSEGRADIALEFPPAALTDAQAAAQLQAQLTALYGFDVLDVSAVRGSGDITFTVRFVRDQAGLDKDPIRAVSASGLVPNPNASVELATATVRNGATVNAGINKLQTVTLHPNVTGGSFTLSFRIENSSGVFEIWTTAPIDAKASALDVYKAVSRLLNPNGSTIDIDPAFDFASRITSRPYTDNVAVRKVGNVFLLTFQGAYRDLSIHDIDTRLLTTQEGTGASEHQALVTTVTLGRTDGEVAVDAKSPRATTVDFTGRAVVTGELWSVTVSLRGVSSTHSYQAASGDTLQAILRLLAGSINDSAADVFAAGNDGDVLVIVNRDGGVFKTTASVGPSGLTVTSIDRSTPTEAAIQLSGKPAAGEVWSITLSTSAGTPTVHSFTVLAGSTLDSIAAGLAAAINSGAPADYFAVAQDAVVLVVRRNGTLFAATPGIAAAGQPQAGSTWTVTLESATSRATSGQAGTGPLVFTHVAGVDATHASVARALAERINLLGRPEFFATAQGGELHIENLSGNVFATTLAVNAVGRPDSVEAAAAVVATRVDGINYYGFESLDVTLGSGDDILNVQGTTAVTNIALGDGNDRIYVSSAANVAYDPSPGAVLPGFLSGHLHNINGALNIDAGAGSAQLLISGEASTLDNADIVITDRILGTEPAGAEIAVRGLTGGDNAFGWVDLPQATITYGGSGDFANGVSVWTGFGADVLWIDGTIADAGVRTITSVNTGLGDDVVYVDLDSTETNGADTSDGLLVLNTQGGWNDYLALRDNDRVVGTGNHPVSGTPFASTLPLIVFGGQGDDSITGGSGNDVLFGDRGQLVRYDTTNGVAPGTVAEQQGGGGPGDVADGLVRLPDLVASVDATVGGNDTIIGLAGDNLLVGGAGADRISAGDGDDTIAGDNARFDFWPNSAQVRVAETTDTLDQPTWGDTIVTGGGANVVLAGMGEDHVNDPTQAFSAGVVPGAGADVVIGDNGRVTWDANGLVDSFMSINRGIVRFDPATGAGNPFAGIDIGSRSAPVFVDIDGDGDLDVFAGTQDGTLVFYENTGTTTAPAYTVRGGVDNPFDGIDVGDMAAPAFADVDGDGDLDAFVGAADGTLAYFVNTGTGTDPVFEVRTGAANPLAGVDVGSMATPVFADMDGDGDLDAIVGEADGLLNYFENTGSATAPVYLPRTGTANPLGGVDVGNMSAPALIDIDGDGDLDLVVGEIGGTLRFFENTGSATAPAYEARTGADNPLDDATSGTLSMPAFGDIDGDGDLDLLVGEDSGALVLLENTSTGAGGRDVILVGDGANIVVGGFGNDTITTGTGSDIVLGDNGAVSFTPGTTDPLIARSTGVVNGSGGDDTITVGEGNNFVIAGVGEDTITAGSGNDLVLGDNGLVIWTPDADLALVQTTDPTLGADDDIQLGEGDNIAAGGFGGDTIVAGAGSDLVVGDNGGFAYTTDANGVAILTSVQTSDTSASTGGADTITAGGGDNVVLAGVGADTVTAGSGADLVLGDNGSIRWTETGVYNAFATAYPAVGGDDTIQAGDGDNIVAGGFGADTIVTGSGQDLVLGDNGAFGYTTNSAGVAILTSAQTADPTGATGGGDTITAGEGDNVVLAGVGGDTVTAGSGIDLVLGDNGSIHWTGTGEYSAFETTDPAVGGDDTIQVGDGDNIVAGGFGSDTVVTGSGQDLILGDNGAFGYTTNSAGVAILTSAQTADPTAATGAGDLITAGDGNNVVIAGLGGDQVTTGSGSDLVLGNNGRILWTPAGEYSALATTEPELGGDDILSVGEGDNIVAGGFGADTITAGAGQDLVLGDNGSFGYTTDANGVAVLTSAQTTDTTEATGGGDTIAAGGGDNVVVAGVGADTVTAGSGVDLVLGDNGSIVWTPAGVYSQFGTTDPTLGGNDDIRVGDGNNIVAGGFGADVIETGVGEDLILGDNGVFTYTTDSNGVAILTNAQTTDSTAATGGNDVIVSGGGTSPDIVLAGAGDDRVNQPARAGSTDPAPAVSAGQDIVVGDNGYVNWNVDGLLTGFGSAQSDVGGNDAIDVGDGDNIVVGGFGDDAITTGVGADIVLGDDGRVDYIGADGDPTDIDVIESISTTAFGGADTISAGAGSDIVIGGRGDDLIDAGEGSNLVIGDSGRVTAADLHAPQLPGQPITLGVVETIQPDDGGNDTITAGNGDNIVLGGFGSDTVSTGAGSDTLIGDNGQVGFTGAVLTTVQSSDIVAGTGGDDVIDGGDGNNLVIGGVGNDRVTTLDGVDVVLGDNGNIVISSGGALLEVASGNPVLGGSDTISTGGGNDVAIGGAQGDTVNGGAGNDVVIGDGGQVTYSNGGTRLDVLSLDVVFGGDDVLDGGAGNDILVGGQGNDRLYGSLSEDLVFGSNAAVTLVDGLATSISSDVQDLVTEALFALFNALPGDDVALADGLLDLLARLEASSDLLDPIDQPDPLLDAELFRKLFSLGAQERSRLSGGLFQPFFVSDVVTLPEAPAHAPLLESAEPEALSGPDAAAAVVQAEQVVDMRDAVLGVLAAGLPDAQDAPGLAGDTLAVTLGLAGLHAVRPPWAGRRCGVVTRRLLRALAGSLRR